MDEQTATRKFTAAQLEQCANILSALATDDGDGGYYSVEIEGDWYDPDNFKFGGSDDFPPGTVKLKTGWVDGDGDDDHTFLTYIAPDGTVVANYEAH